MQNDFDKELTLFKMWYSKSLKKTQKKAVLRTAF